MTYQHRKIVGRGAELGWQTADRLARKGLRLSHLRLMVALERTGQVSAAAAALAISQPAASRLCAELEEISGVKLYARHGRGVELTPYGERLARRAARILRELEDADREISELRSGFGGKVWIGAVTGAAVELVLPAIQQARLSHPRIDVSVEVAMSDELASALEAGRIDFYLGRIPANRDPRLYRARLVAEEPVGLMVRPGHPLLRQDPVRLEDCIACDWVMQPEGSLLRRTVEAYLREHGVGLPAKVLNTSSLLLTVITVSQTDAIAPMARGVADFVGSRLETLHIAQKIAIPPYSLLTLAEQELSPASQVLYELIGQRLRELGDRRTQASPAGPAGTGVEVDVPLAHH